jgi:predicted MFS family arabinose efflux permease
MFTHVIYVNGFAAGYIYGGLVSSDLGWRAAFFIESAAILPFVVFAIVSKPLHLTGSRETGPGGLWGGVAHACCVSYGVLLHHLRVLVTSMGGWVSAAFGWRAACFIESAAILPFVVFAFVSKPLHLTGSRETGPGGLLVFVSTRLCCASLCVGVHIDHISLWPSCLS